VLTSAATCDAAGACTTTTEACMSGNCQSPTECAGPPTDTSQP
jgi:hypothetical protein